VRVAVGTLQDEGALDRRGETFEARADIDGPTL
jgi:hypothetical protein